ncbi:MAG: HIT domain-containing protein, partial [Terriglobia bacterium]
PQAPTHVLIVPVRHFASATEVPASEQAAVLGELLQLAVKVAEDSGLAGSGYRTVMNTGRQGGQTVEHLHIHLLGGRQMHWPPG